MEAWLFQRSQAMGASLFHSAQVDVCPFQRFGWWVNHLCQCVAKECGAASAVAQHHRTARARMEPVVSRLSKGNSKISTLPSKAGISPQVTPPKSGSQMLIFKILERWNCGLGGRCFDFAALGFSPLYRFFRIGNLQLFCRLTGSPLGAAFEYRITLCQTPVVKKCFV